MPTKKFCQKVKLLDGAVEHYLYLKLIKNTIVFYFSPPE